MYKLEFLPSAKQDLIELVTYISRELNESAAALNIAQELIEATEQLSAFPYSHPAYYPIKPLKHEYRKMVVRHYLIFYWVDEDKKLVTIARVIYARRNYEDILN